MSFTTKAMVVGLRLVDLLDRQRQPWDAFTRPALPPAQKTLKQLETEFFDDLMANFWVCKKKIIASRLPLPIGSTVDTGDQALWHGIYTGVLALRYHLQPDTQTEGYLINASEGMRLHQTIQGELKPRLIRGVSDDLATWQDDASNDSATGHLFGIYFGWKYGPASLRPMFARLADGLAQELASHHHSLVRADGKPTTYGALEQGWVTSPLRITLALAIYAVAYQLTSDTTYWDIAASLMERYRSLIPYAKVRLRWQENYNDTHRAAIHLALLANNLPGLAFDKCLEGFERTRSMVREDGNVWVNALCTWGGRGEMGERSVALKVLSEFSLSDKQYNYGIDRYATPPAASDQLQFKPVLWNGTWMANQPLPRWLVRPQDFFWQRNLRSLDVGSNKADADSRLNGGDFLAAYWLCRLNGTLTEGD